MSKQVIIAFKYLCAILGLTKRKGKDTSEIIEKLMKLEEEKDKKMEAQAKQYLEIELKREQDRIEREEKHEERMFTMFSSFMGQMMQMSAPQMTVPQMYRNDYMPNYYSNVPYPPASQRPPEFEETSLNVGNSDHN